MMYPLPYGDRGLEVSRDTLKVDSCWRVAMVVAVVGGGILVFQMILFLLIREITSLGVHGSVYDSSFLTFVCGCCEGGTRLE